MHVYNYTYTVIEPHYVDFNITKRQSNGHVMYFNVLKDNIDLYSNVAVHLVTANTPSSTEFVNKTINICKLINDRRYEPFIRIFYLIFREYSPNFFNRCPIKKVCTALVVVNFVIIVYLAIRNYTTFNWLIWKLIKFHQFGQHKSLHGL